MINIPAGELTFYPMGCRAFRSQRIFNSFHLLFHRKGCSTTMVNKVICAKIEEPKLSWRLECDNKHLWPTY